MAHFRVLFVVALALLQAASAHESPNIAEINKDLNALIGGCLLPDYQSIKHFYGQEYADEEVKRGKLVKEKFEPNDIIRDDEYLWRKQVEDGLFVIPWQYDSDARFTDSEKETIETTFENFGKAVGSIKFRQRNSRDNNWLQITSEEGCWASLGRDRGSKANSFNLGPDCVNPSTVIHEAMHALGFFHEQQRQDRDEYLDIYWDNIKDDFIFAFEKASRTEANGLGAPYDYGSAMHYRETSFNKREDLQTIYARGFDIGANLPEASAIDIIQLRLLYQCKSGVRLFRDYIRNPCTSDCKCPIGQSGCDGNDNACLGDAKCVNDVCTIRGYHEMETVCQDFPFFDGTNGCQGYANSLEWCEKFGYNQLNSAQPATKACCACGGGQPKMCKTSCPFSYEPVCGTNSQTYLNICELERVKCKDPNIALWHEGVCGTSECHKVIRASQFGSQIERCAPNREKHKLRCCSDRPRPGFTHARCKDGGRLYVATKFGSLCKTVSWREGNEFCRIRGARMCTEDEVSRHCTMNTGCGFDTSVIWTNTPALADWKGKGAESSSSSSSSTEEEGAEECHNLVLALPTAKGEETCAPNSEKHPLRCCSDKKVPGFKQRWCKGTGKTLWTESGSAQFKGCQRTTWDQGNKLCKSMGARLCTAAEVSNHCTKGTGCGFDNGLVWTSSQDVVEEEASTEEEEEPIATTCHKLVKATSVATGRQRCALDHERHPLRCCSDTLVKDYKFTWCRKTYRSLFTESDTEPFKGCQRAVTWKEGNEICTGMGARMCTEDEVAGECTKGTGCGLDHGLLWTSTEGTPP